MIRAEERWVDAALEEHFRGPEPPDLTAAILAVRQGSARRPGRWVAAALLLAGLGTVALVPLLHEGAPAQDPEDERYLPLGVGGQWEYSLDGLPVTEAVMGSTRIGELDVLLIRSLGGGPPRFRYLAENAEALYVFPCGGDLPILPNNAESKKVLALPPVVGASLEWVEPRPIQGAVARVGPPIQTFGMKATVIAVDEEVVVPAGTFSAVHLRIEVTDPGLRSTRAVEDLWCARGVGIVRSETRVGDDPEARARRQDLVRFTPGRPPWSWQRELPALLAKSRVLGARGMPDEMEPVPLGASGFVLHSRFARLRWGEEEVFARVSFDDAATIALFDPEDLDDWNALVDAEPSYRALPDNLAQGCAGALAELAGRLRAARSGAEVLGFLHTRSVNISRDRWSVDGRLRIRSTTGEESLECGSTIERRRVVRIEVR